MRNAVVQLPEYRSAGEERQVLRAAMRQLERAELYFAAVEGMDLDDREVGRALNRLRTETVQLRRYLGERRSALRQ